MILVDTADPAQLNRLLWYPFVTGFTTNPALVLRAAGVPALYPEEYLTRVEGLFRLAAEAPEHCRHVMVQVGEPVAAWPVHISLWEGHTRAWRRERGGRLWIKVPPTIDGLAACSLIKAHGLESMVTAVFTPAQAAAALEAGASGLVCYLRRMKERAPDWQHRTGEIARIAREAGRTLLVASVPDRAYFEEALGYSPHVTIAPEAADALLADELSAEALARFDACLLPEGVRVP